MVNPLHTPGIYTTPVAFTSAFVFDLDLSFLGSNGQKQSINDASQYVVVLTHPPEGVGMNVAKIQIIFEIKTIYLRKNII